MPRTAAPEEVQVAIIGGGINGAGLARDLALRGISAALFEKRDLGAGATGGSSGMIHGGPRYLLSDRRTTYHSSLDAGHIRRIASHLTFRIPFLMPVLRKGRFSRLLLDGYEAFVAAYDRFQPLKEGKRHHRLSAEAARALEPELSDRVIGAVTMDEWGVDPYRLVVLNAVDAAEHGASVHPYTEVTGLLRQGPRVTGLSWQDALSGERGRTRAALVVNLAGPWAPQVCAMAGLSMRLRPGKGVHLIVERRLNHFAITAQAVDGRQIFMIPHEHCALIGTTDDDYYGDLDRIPITEDEIEYLLQGMERVLPAIRKARIIRAIAAVRPTLYRHGVSEDDLSRAHRIDDHDKDGAPGLWSMTGGKLASYRLMCQELGDHLAQGLGNDAGCATHLFPLPGSEQASSAEALVEEFDIAPEAALRLHFRHGCRSRRILEAMRAEPATRAMVCACDPVLECELRYVIRHEFVRQPGDLRRRAGLGSGPCQGRECAFHAGAVLAREIGALAPAALDFTADFLDGRHRGTLPVLGGVSAASEELKRATFHLSGRLSRR